MPYATDSMNDCEATLATLSKARNILLTILEGQTPNAGGIPLLRKLIDQMMANSTDVKCWGVKF